MKAVVLAIQGKKAAVLCENGDIVKIPAANHTVGQQIDNLRIGKTRLNKRIMAYAACCAALLLICIYGIHSFFSPYSYLSIDSASSVEFVLNRYNMVIGVAAADSGSEEFVEVLKSSGVLFGSVTKGVSVAYTELENENEGSGDEENYILCSVTAKKDTNAADVEERVVVDVKKATDECSTEIKVNTTVIQTSSTCRDEAKELGTTAGKLCVAKKYAEVTGDVEGSHYADALVMSVSEMLNKLINGGCCTADDISEHPNKNTTDKAEATPTQKAENSSASEEDSNSKTEDTTPADSTFAELPGTENPDAVSSGAIDKKPDKSDRPDWSDADNDAYVKPIRDIVNDALTDAQKEADKALKDAQKEADKALRDAQREADKALKDAQDETDDALKDAQDEVDDALKDAQDETDKALKDARDEADKALKDAFDEADKALKDAHDETDDALKDAQDETDDALNDARDAVDDALKYIPGNDGEINDAVDDVLKDVQNGLSDLFDSIRDKNNNHDEDDHSQR